MAAEFRFAALAVLFFFGISSVLAQEDKTGDAKVRTAVPSEHLALLAKNAVRFTLPNGLRVIFYRRAHSPIFSSQIWVKAGGVNEVPGQTGVFHLLEHMAFKGTPAVGTRDWPQEKQLLERYEQVLDELARNDAAALKEELRHLEDKLAELQVTDEFSNIYRARGASGLNAATSKEYTMYMVSLPASEFELWCWMESERLLQPVFRQFYKERDVVLEERRMRTDDNPGGRVFESLLAAAYWVHPNRLPIIGWREDLQRLRTRHVEAAHRQYYRADNIVISLVGDLDVERIRMLMEKYFGRLPEPAGVIPPLGQEEPLQQGERRVEVVFDAEPRLVLAYHKPGHPDPDHAVFAVLQSLLSDGRSSLLHRRLIQEKHLAISEFAAEMPGELYPSLLVLGATPRRVVSNERVLAEIVDVVRDLQNRFLPEAEVAAAKKRLRTQMLQDLSSNYGLARFLARGELLFGRFETQLDFYLSTDAVTALDIQRVARRYLVPENRTIVMLRKSEKGKRAWHE